MPVKEERSPRSLVPIFLSPMFLSATPESRNSDRKMWDRKIGKRAKGSAIKCQSKKSAVRDPLVPIFLSPITGLLTFQNVPIKRREVKKTPP
jgi:hypothetical protein